MCGILGFNWNDEKLGRKLGQLIKHRGPDGEGYYSDERVTLGHRRLSIIDLSERGKQPMSNEDGTVWITYNGEVFNFKELRSELLEKGHKFASDTDTEVIVHGYEEYGVKILDKLNGQFAFCIYDTKKKELFLARDRIGINPLYYYHDKTHFVFCSELKVIMKSGVPKEIDEFALNYYLMFGYTPRDQSILKNAFKLEPGHYIIFDLKKSSISECRKYWQIKPKNSITDEMTAISSIRKQLDRSVKRRLVADVPVGAFLSGGLDSSLVVALMSKYTRNLNTFSIRFDHEDFDESVYAEKISRLFKTKHNVIRFTGKDVEELMKSLAYHYDEPFGDPSMIPTFLVSKVARQHVTVSLSGDGGDELFGGYVSYKHYRMLKVQDHYPSILNKAALRLYGNEKVKAFLEAGTLKKRHRFAYLMSNLELEDAWLLAGDPEKYLEKYSRSFLQGPAVNEATHIDLHNYISENIMTKVDRACLANSLESRPPLLDHEMIELACKMHPKLKLRKGEGKYILKKAFEDVLPHDVIYRKKQGFGVPLKHYFRDELKGLVDKYTRNNKKIIKLRSKLSDKGRDHSRIIWRIMMLNMWMERWQNES